MVVAVVPTSGELFKNSQNKGKNTTNVVKISVVKTMYMWRFPQPVGVSKGDNDLIQARPHFYSPTNAVSKPYSDTTRDTKYVV